MYALPVVCTGLLISVSFAFVALPGINDGFWSSIEEIVNSPDCGIPGLTPTGDAFEFCKSLLPIVPDVDAPSLPAALLFCPWSISGWGEGC